MGDRRRGELRRSSRYERAAVYMAARSDNKSASAVATCLSDYTIAWTNWKDSMPVHMILGVSLDASQMVVPALIMRSDLPSIHEIIRVGREAVLRGVAGP